MKTSSENNFDGSEIAICAMVGRFPGATDLPAFWRNLRDGVESISSFDREEVLAAGEDPELAENTKYVNARGVVHGADLFDAAFFGFAPREAEMLDPQHRLLLECAWEALEQAGYDPQRFKGAIGLVAGATASTYLAHQLYRNRPVMKSFGDVETTIYNSPGTAATLTAYKLNLKGPSLSVQTFCSTSLVAVHCACQSLLNFETDIALAGGVTIHAPQIRGYLYQEGSILSHDGKCRVFDTEADGTVFGNGIGVIVLKRLKDALADRDVIHAVIRGSAVNNDGSLKVSFTAPSVVGQTEVIVEALGAAGVNPETIEYVEAHGTGTKLGDPAEIEALTKAFRAGTNKTGFCAIGSAKANVGHLDAAAGIAGLIKAVLCLKHRQIPPALYCRALNPLINFRNSPFFVSTSLLDWKRGAAPRRAGVSAFGIGGTNAHVILEEAPDSSPDDPSRPCQLILLSAKTSVALDEASRRIAQWLRIEPQINLADAAYTLQVGRREFGYRRALVARDTSTAAALLEAGDSDAVMSMGQDRRNPQVVFVFNGDGEAFVDMARGLYEYDRTFRNEMARAFAAAKQHAACDLNGMYPLQRLPTAARHQLDDPLTRRVALFVVQHALARLWISWGIRPAAIIGHGIGELAAACVAGVLTQDGALTLLANESRRSAAAGSARAGDVRLTPPAIPLFSATTGGKLSSDNAIRPDRWDTGPANSEILHTALEQSSPDSKRVLLEIGSPAAPPMLAEAIATLRRSTDGFQDVEHVLRALGRLWLAGIDVDWDGFYGGERRKRMALPTYPFDRQRFWVDIAEEETPELPPPPQPPMPSLEKNPDIGRWFYVPEWRQTPPAEYYAGGRSIDPSAKWLVFADGDEFCAEVVANLARRIDDAQIVLVRSGEGFERTAVNRYTIDPSRRDDYMRLFDDLAHDLRLPDVVLHLWEVSDENDQLEAATAEAAQDRGFYSLIWLAQAILAHPRPDGTTKVAIKIVISGLHEITGGERLRPDRATMLGPGQIISREYPDIRCHTIDVDLCDAKYVRDGSAVLAARIVDELIAEVPEIAVAYRRGVRWSPYLESIAIAGSQDRPARLRERGVYFITGGFGAIGSALARHLAKTVRAKLVLVGLTPLPPKSEWDARLRRHDQESGAQRLRLVRELEDAGAEVLAPVADVADRLQMRLAIAEAIARFGGIDGVIAAAGITGAGVIQQKQHDGTSVLAPVEQLRREVCDVQFRPKMRGLFVLEDVLGNRPLDFCLVVSSLSSVFAGPGYSAYAAANIFMDAFVCRHNQQHPVKWLSANFDAWSFSNSETGSMLSRMTMTESEGVEAFNRLMAATNLGQVFVSIADLHARLAGAAAASTSAADDGINADKTSAGESPTAPDTRVRTYYARPLTVEAAFEAPLTPLECTVADVWRDVLGIDRIGRRDNFLELGGHSLLAVQIAARLEDALAIELPMRHVFDAATVADLAARIQMAVSSMDVDASAGQATDAEEVEI